MQCTLQAESFSYRRLVSDVRMDHARALFLNTELTVTEIAHHLGHNDSTQLTRAFSQPLAALAGERPSQSAVCWI